MNESPAPDYQAIGIKLHAMDRVAFYTLWCAVASRIPTWWANSPIVTSLQLKMLAEISDIYGVHFTQDLARPFVASLAGGGLSVLLSQNPLTMAMKTWVLAIPVVGVPIRYGTGPFIIGFYCYTLGRAFVEHYETGGTYHDFDTAKFRAQLRSSLGLAPA
jgi:uncharacterized protein (DUF697 family)